MMGGRAPSGCGKPPRTCAQVGFRLENWQISCWLVATLPRTREGNADDQRMASEFGVCSVQFSKSLFHAYELPSPIPSKWYLPSASSLPLH